MNEPSVQMPESTVVALTFEPIQTRRAFEEICHSIREQVAAGALKPGDKLPAERDLANQLGVGRNALREALRSLEIAGIVRLKKGVKGGAFIHDGQSGRMNQVVQDMFALGSISLAELTETRVHIQDVVVRLACVRATAADCQAIEANIDRTELMTRTEHFLDRVECSREFYRLLAAATHNEVLATMVASLTEILMKFVYARVAAGGDPQPNLIAKRRKFLAALRERNVELACRLMRTHLESVHRLMEEVPRADATSSTRASARAPVRRQSAA